LPVENCCCALRPHPEGPPKAGVSKDEPQSNGLKCDRPALRGRVSGTINAAPSSSAILACAAPPPLSSPPTIS